MRRFVVALAYTQSATLSIHPLLCSPFLSASSLDQIFDLPTQTLSSALAFAGRSLLLRHLLRVYPYRLALSPFNSGKRATMENSYEILQELGSGSFGVVFKAIERATSEVVAIKMAGLLCSPSSHPANIP
jgi:hypothetical protein